MQGAKRRGLMTNGREDIGASVVADDIVSTEQRTVAVWSFDGGLCGSLG